METTHWTLETLNKAYQQGYMTGLTGRGAEECRYQNDVLVAAWEAGWDDGYQQHQRARKKDRFASPQGSFSA